jgi:N-acetylmuramoyl-L-alanine amidase
MTRLAPFLAACLLAGCAAGPAIDTTYRSAGHESRVQFLVIHFTSEGFAPSLKVLTEGPVSSHYLVNDAPPTIYRLVEEDRRAWHAGVSSWQGNTNLNSSSIGIEIVNTGLNKATGTWAEYPEPQLRAVIELVQDIVRRHKIRPDRIVGHSDIAPQRKVDPGPRFPWKRLADVGLMAWPDAGKVAQRRVAFEATLPDVAWFQKMLARHGFAVPEHGELDGPTRRVVAAFQMKYRPAAFDGTPDAETAAILDVLVNP